MNHPHKLADCPLCSAVHAMNEDDVKQQKYWADFFERWVESDMLRWRSILGTPRATTTRDPFRFSEDDVLDAHQALKQIDRIPSEWRA